MRKFISIPLSIAAILTACDSSSTAPDSFTKGELIHERHFDHNLGNMKCNVYATDNSVSIDLNVNMINDNSNMKQQLEWSFGNKANFRGKSEVSGLFVITKDELCESMKKLANEMENGSYTCTENGATISASPSDYDESQKKLYVASSKSTMKRQCDSWYDDFTRKFDEMAQNIAVVGNDSSGNLGEKAQSCESVVNGNTLTTTIRYPDKSAIMSMTKENGGYTINEEYTGIDAATLARVCEAYNNETEIKNVVCSGSTITYQSNTSEVPEITDYLDISQKYECPGVLNGTLTLEDLWFD